MKNNGGDEMRLPTFFKVFLPANSSREMQFPPAFAACVDGLLHKKAILRNSRGIIWLVELRKARNDIFFSKGWPGVVIDNDIQVGDFIVFRHFGDNIFDFKVYGITGCEKNGADAFEDVCWQYPEVKVEEESEEEEEKEKEARKKPRKEKESEEEEEESEDDDDNDDEEEEEGDDDDDDDDSEDEDYQGGGNSNEGRNVKAKKWEDDSDVDDDEYDDSEHGDYHGGNNHNVGTNIKRKRRDDGSDVDDGDDRGQGMVGPKVTGKKNSLRGETNRDTDL